MPLFPHTSHDIDTHTALFERDTLKYIYRHTYIITIKETHTDMDY